MAQAEVAYNPVARHGAQTDLGEEGAALAVGPVSSAVVEPARTSSVRLKKNSGQIIFKARERRIIQSPGIVQYLR